MEGGPAELTLVHADEGSVLGVYRNLFVQVRRGVLSKAVLERVALRSRVVQRQSPQGIGLLSVLEADAPIPDADVRATQVAAIREMISRGRFVSAIVVLGSGIQQDLRKTTITSIRTMSSNPDQRVETNVSAGARFLAQTFATGDAAQRELASTLEKCVDALRTKYHAR